MLLTKARMFAITLKSPFLGADTTSFLTDSTKPNKTKNQKGIHTMYEIKNNHGKFDLLMNGELLHSFNNEGYAKGSVALLSSMGLLPRAEALMALKFSGQLKADRNA